MKRKKSLFHGLFLTFLMALPLIVGIACLTGFTYGMWGEYKRYTKSLAEGGWLVQSELAVLHDGTPVISNYIRHENSYEDKRTTMDGREVPPDTQTSDRITLQPDLDEMMYRIQFQARLVVPIKPLSYRPPLQFVEADHPRHIWLFRESDRNPGAYFLIKTDRDQQQVIRGYFDRNGPREDEPGLETSFGEPLGVIESKGVIVFQSGAEILAVDLNSNTVEQISDQTALRWGFCKGESNDEHCREIILVTEDEIRTVDYSGKEIHAYAVDGKESQFFITDDERLLVKTIGDYESERTADGQLMKWMETLYELGDDGQSRKLAQFNRTGTFAAEVGTAWVRSVDSFIGKTGLGIVFPGPGVLLGVESGGAYLILQFAKPENRYAAGWREIQKQSPWAFPMSAVFGAIAAYFCYRRQRRYQAAWTKTWTVFVFLFGPAGYFAWRWHREWPPLELVGVTREEFEGPAANGLEVFA